MSSGAHLSRLLLRGVVGGTMIAHGVKHGRSLQGTAGWFKSIGFRQPKLQAATSAVVEVGAGSALVVGAATPLAAASVIGTLGVAARTVHVPNGFWITQEGWEYVLVLGTAAAAVAALGPGPVSVDAVLKKDRGGALVGLGAIALGLAGTSAQTGIFWRRPVQD